MSAGSSRMMVSGWSPGSLEDPSFVPKPPSPARALPAARPSADAPMAIVLASVMGSPVWTRPSTAAGTVPARASNNASLELLQRVEELENVARERFGLFQRREVPAARHRGPASDVGVGPRRERARRTQD